MSPTNPPRPTVASLSAHIEDHESRIEDLEARLNKYDVIIARLDTIIDIMVQRVEATATKADTAIESQGLMKERNENAHRWANWGMTLGIELLVAIAAFVLGYVLH